MRPDRVIASWFRTKRAMSMNADALADRRAAAWTKLQPALSRTPALAGFAGRALCEYPITDQADMRRDYGAWNSLGMDDAALRNLADAAEEGAQASDLSAGWSSGSGGRARGLFVANSTERADYLGQSLARLLPTRALFQRQRIALHLRANNALYSDVKNGRFAFAHIPLDVSQDQAIAALSAFEPTILIAPAQRLLRFAKAGVVLGSLRHLFTGSEPMSAAEADCIETAFGLRPRAIYQATEGFLGAECEAGQLHLNEHAIAFEWEPVAGTIGHRPIITDLRRSSQPIVRLRGDDYIERPEIGPCACGFGGTIIHPPQGRITDIWRFEDRVFTPPQVVAAVEGALGGMIDWQAAADRETVSLRLSPEARPSVGAEAAAALEQLTGRRVTHNFDLSGWPGPKRRKVVWASD